MGLKTLGVRVAAQPQRLATGYTEQRTRGSKLQAMRKRLFQSSPLCVECQQQGRVALATERDHIIPLWQGGRDSEANCQALCSACHKAKSAREVVCGNVA